jgi:hypothetical protein
MTDASNPLKLNPLQLKTLTLLQAIARFPQATAQGPGEGEVTVLRFPPAHGDHFHLGDAIVRGADATGLTNQAVWKALEHKGLVKSNYPQSLILTKDGIAYDTGMADKIFHSGGH